MYQIKDWDKHFENYKSRDCEKCSYICMPNKQGLGWQRLMAEPDGIQLFGIWCLLLQTCSRHRKRNGWLTFDGLEESEQWTVEDLAFMWRCTSEQVSRMLDVCSSAKVGWISQLKDKYPTGIQSVSDQYTKNPRKEGRKEGKNKTCDAPQAGSLASNRFIFLLKTGTTWELLDSEAEKLYNLYPNFDVRHELKSAAHWLEVNPSRRKTAGGMLRFLSGWLKRSAPQVAVVKPIKEPPKSGFTQAAEIVERDGWQAVVAKYGIDGVDSELGLVRYLKENDGFHV